MYVARILYPVKTLGPGERIGIWFCGCTRHCRGCSNPELWERQEKYHITQSRLMELIHSLADYNSVDGFTLTGGDPIEQAEELSRLLPELREISTDILLYTGFTIEQLHEQQSSCVNSVLEKVSVLVDGEYIMERNNNCPLRGSDNQRVIFLDESQREKYEEYMRRGNAIQNFTIGNSVVSVGIHNADYDKQLAKLIAKKNLISG
ncbi:MAG: 4Fe-4S single cluster domain-containing protein [Oscillospiraceae bacterium]